MKSPNNYLAGLPTTIFTVMSQLAVEHDAVNLGQGFPDTEGPAALIDAAADALRDNRNQYAPLTGLPELREAVARSNARSYGLSVDPDREVVVTSGATEAIAACLMAVVESGDEVVLIEPLYDTYLPVLRMIGATPRCVRLHPPEWTLVADELRAAFGTKTKAILLNSPMNPSGKVFSVAELDLIADLVREFDAYAVCDEVYEHLTFGVAHVPLMTRPGMRERCMRIGSAGKSFSLTGWKVGYVTAPPALAALVAKAHQLLVFATAPNLQRAVAVGLNLEEDYFHELADDLRRKRDLLATGLHALGFPTLPADGSYFVVADISRHAEGRDDVAFCRDLVRTARVAAIPVSAFYAPDGPEPPRHLIRFAFCKREAVLQEALSRLGGVFRG
ncbi:transaminase [Neoasaia chiangmaiensis NBRC 101099]|uniref:Aminotransferase n=1 Tax=Neoasaia chiangmaiensis TaxID=320497 RepID=A0A1U9KSF8_9PROT|nr:aminotransferase [Neoasaia chiangmaiensis]AQS88590.1 aminotransferase [Neoasaia chiangmaiensis]GBR36196.1 transaminase [Neoasaia chiangmaiensis NBRC 101099]GEN15438.1 aminotransferase [Neoasaia chiangmaiensis]